MKLISFFLFFFLREEEKFEYSFSLKKVCVNLGIICAACIILRIILRTCDDSCKVKLSFVFDNNEIHWLNLREIYIEEFL